MAPSNTCVTSQLRHLIYYYIDNNLLKNALFLSERLAAYDHRSFESAYLLSLCHLRLGDNPSAYEHAKSVGSKGGHLGCAYVFAQACLALERYKDGINALEKSKVLWSGKNSFGKHTASSRQPLPDAPAVNCLLGKLYFGWDNKPKAIICFEDALKSNPFFWDAFTSLCDMGVNVRVPSIFKINSEMEALLQTDQSDFHCHSRDTTLSLIPNHDRNHNPSRPNSVANEVPDPFNNIPSRSFASGLFGTLGISQKLSESNPSLTNLPAAGGGGIGPEAMETPTGPSASIDVTAAQNRRDLVSVYSAEPPQAPVRKTRTITGLGMDFSMDVPRMPRGASKRAQKVPESIEESAAIQTLRLNGLATVSAGERKRTVSGQVVPRQGSEDPGAPQRRSVRLFQKQPSISSKSSSSNLPTVGPPPGRELKKARPPISKSLKPNSSAAALSRPLCGSKKQVDDTMETDQREVSTRSWANSIPNVSSQKSSEPNIAKQEEALKAILDMLKKIGNGYFALSKFQCLEALQIYNSLPRSHQETPYIMTQMGRAYYEQAAYTDAERYFKKVRLLAPTRFEDMEIYSTILWHLKRETDLAFLAHELIDASWQSPQAWCALGNSWSLARDHEQALRCFKRATQLNPKFAYAFTLQGHEHVANEEYDKALVSYRSGMTADKRHYNAWYGVGRVFEKLGNYDKAFAHFSAASSINPTNAVLICCIGTVLEKQKQHRQALQYFTRATELAPRSALTRFKKARTLMNISEPQAALAELMILKDIAPEEAMVHFLLGKLYKSMKEKSLAVRHFTIALNLDPKASQQIKDSIESLEDDEDEASMMD